MHKARWTLAGQAYSQIWMTGATLSGPHAALLLGSLEVSLLVLIFLFPAS